MISKVPKTAALFEALNRNPPIIDPKRFSSENPKYEFKGIDFATREQSKSKLHGNAITQLLIDDPAPEKLFIPAVRHEDPILLSTWISLGYPKERLEECLRYIRPWSVAGNIFHKTIDTGCYKVIAWALCIGEYDFRVFNTEKEAEGARMLRGLPVIERLPDASSISTNAAVIMSIQADIAKQVANLTHLEADVCSLNSDISKNTVSQITLNQEIIDKALDKAPQISLKEFWEKALKGKIDGV